MTPSFQTLLLANFVLCAAALWLSAQTAAAAAARGGRSGVALSAAATLLAASGLGWPSRALPAHPVFGNGQDGWLLLAQLPGLLLCAAAALAAAWFARARHARALAAAATLPGLAYAHAMLLAPGVFGLSQTSAPIGAGVLLLGIAVGLVLLRIQWPNAAAARLAPIAAAVGVAVLASIAAAVSAPLPGSAQAALAPPSMWPQLPAMAVLLALAGVLLFVARHAGSGLPAAPRRAQPDAEDALTRLPTRLFFERRLHAGAKACDARGSRLAVLFVDLDGFKPVNDTFGHNSGDRVLEQVGRRLRALVRNNDVAARVGGDEFVLLLPGAAQEAAARAAARVTEALNKPYRIGGREVSISCSIGIALYPDGCHANKLIARADAAMYAAKRAGGSRHCFFSPEMDMDVQQNFDLLRDLRHALAHDRLELFFQPKIDARSGKVTAAEALLRWKHPTRGLIGPDVFVPLAERSGLIGPLGNWVIEAACKQARAWRDAGLRMRVAINLSTHQMRQDDIAERIADALRRHRIHPSLLTCEITESAAMEDTGATQETFRRLGELGAHLSIDDFGTGYSSLSYLRQLPAEELKIDAAFVKDVDRSADARAVVDAVVKLAHALGLKVVAEGVETPRQQHTLVELGCDELQGFLFARPMSARALLLWALGDRSKLTDFRDSLFGETRAASRQMGLSTVGR